LPPPDQDAQRERLLAELGNPAFYIERVVVAPPVAVDLPATQFDQPQMVDVTPKSYVEDNVRRSEASTTTSTIGPNASQC
jgi:hypothetical protein